MATIALPFAASAPRRAPAAELSSGYPCGPLDEELDNWLEWWVTGQIAAAIDAGGLTVDDANLLRLAQANQSGKSTYAVATGSANAWVVAPNLAVPAYAAGRVLNIIAPATNTSTTVNMSVSGLGNRRIKKADGSDPAVGDLVGGVAYPTIDDGTSIRILTPLQSDMLATIKAQKSVYNVQSFRSATRTTLTGPSDGSTWVTVFSGTVTKVSETSRLSFDLSMPIWSPGPQAPTKVRVVIGGVETKGVTQYSFGSDVYGQLGLANVLSGLGAGSLAWTLEFSRSNTGGTWFATVNPTNADAVFYDATGTATLLQFSEFEP